MKPTKFKILVVGESLSQNLGDQAILEGLKCYLISRHCFVDSIDLSGRKEVSREVSNKGNTIVKNMVAGKFIPYINMLRSLVIVITNIRTISIKIKNSDLIAFGGGSLLIDNNLSFPSKLYFYSLICRFYKRKYIVIGCSARKVNKFLARYFINEFLKKSQKIGVRDEVSLKILKSNGVDAFITQDPALFLPQHHKKGGVIKKNKIGINVMADQSHGYFSNRIKYEEYRDLTDAIIEKIVERNDVIVFTTGDHRDNEIVKRDYIGRNNIYTPANINELLTFISELDKILCVRLHASILAITQELIPFALSWDEKVSGFFETNKLDKFYINLDEGSFTIGNIIEYFNCEVQDEDRDVLNLIKKNLQNDYDSFFYGLI